MKLIHMPSAESDEEKYLYEQIRMLQEAYYLPQNPLLTALLPLKTWGNLATIWSLNRVMRRLCRAMCLTERAVSCGLDDATRNFSCNLQFITVLRSYKNRNAMQHHPLGCCICCV